MVTSLSALVALAALVIAAETLVARNENARPALSQAGGSFV